MPDFVLQGIAQKQAPVPFATTGGNEDDGAPEADDDGIAATAKKKAKKTTQSTQRNTKKQKKKVNEAALMAEVENGLKPPLLRFLLLNVCLCQALLVVKVMPVARTPMWLETSLKKEKLSFLIFVRVAWPTKMPTMPG